MEKTFQIIVNRQGCVCIDAATSTEALLELYKQIAANTDKITWSNAIDTESIEQVDIKHEHGEEKSSFTAFAFEDGSILSVDAATYSSKEKAIKFAKNRGWDEVVNDLTGETVWRRSR